MQSSFRQFEIKFKLLITITLTLCALGFLLIPGKLKEITGGMPIWVSLSLGVILYVAGLLNQTTIFTTYKPFIQRLTAISVIFGLSALGLIYIRAGMLVDGILIVALLLGQFYYLAPGIWNRVHTDGVFFLIYAILFVLSAGIILSGWMTWVGYQLQGNIRFVFGGLFIVGSVASFAAYYFVRERQEFSTIIYKLTIIPWLVWGIYFFLAQRMGTVMIVTGLVVMPLIDDYFSWENDFLHDSDQVGVKYLYFSSLTEFLILIALITIEYNALQLFFTNNVFLQNDVPLFSQGLSFITLVVYKGLSIYLLITIGFPTRFLKAPSPDIEQVGRDVTALHKGWPRWLSRSINYYSPQSLNFHAQVITQNKQIETLALQLAHEKKRTMHHNLLSELSHQLEMHLDQPVSAQLAVNTLQEAINCTFVAILEHDLERRELFTIATIGTVLPSNYRQSASNGYPGRTLRLRKIQITNNADTDPEFTQIGSKTIISALAIPIMQHGHVRAILELGDEKRNFFTSHDIRLAELVAVELTRAWERSSYRQRLTNLIKAGDSLSPILEPQTIIKEVATIAREILQARFVFVTLSDQESKLSCNASSGNAPRLLGSINQHSKEDTTIQAALNAQAAFRIRDVQKYRKDSLIEIDHNGLRSLLAIPIRLHGLSIGAILAFGKQKENLFSESDVTLGNLLALQTGTAIETAWVYQELRNTLDITSQLYHLNVKIIQAEGLQQAVQQIVETGFKISKASVAGIVLFAKDQQIESNTIIDDNGTRFEGQHPYDLIQQALDSGQTMHVSLDQVSTTICFPLQTKNRKYGALWLEVSDAQEFFTYHASNMQVLANQAILTMERSIFLVESQQQLMAIKVINDELELAYDQTIIAFATMLDAYDREARGHSTRVSELVCLLGVEMGLDTEALKTLERGSLLHEIGKIGISEFLLHKVDNLNEKEWKTVRAYPDIGARIIEDIPFLRETLPIIRYHQERWDGSGYPIGLIGKDIPFQARIFAVADTYDTFLNNSPGSKHHTADEAMDYLREQAGVLFDPEVVSAFEEMWKQNEMGEMIL